MYKCKCCGKPNNYIKGNSRMIVNKGKFVSGVTKDQFVCHWCGKTNLIKNGNVEYVI